MTDAPEPRTPPAGHGPSTTPVPPGGFAPPGGFPQQRAYAPPAGYPVPAGYGPVAGSPTGPLGGAAAPRSPVTGRVALILALAATVGAALMGALAAFNIGLGAGREMAVRPFAADFDWSILTPVRDWVLLAEVSFWMGTVLGVWAFVQGIVAIATARGRGPGIAAVVISALGPVAFAVVVQALVTAGFASGNGVTA